MALLRDLAARNATARTAPRRALLATETLAAKPQDVLFALAYLDDELQSSHTRSAENSCARSRPELVKDARHRVVEPGDAGRPGWSSASIPRRPFDDQYRAFLDLVADQFGTALANARAYEEERQRAEALAELDRAKTTFFSNVSHEFRTPLTLLVGPLEDGLADAGTPLPPVHRERQEVAHRNALRLLRLVNTLLDFSRIEAGRIDASYEPTDLARSPPISRARFDRRSKRPGLALVVDCRSAAAAGLRRPGDVGEDRPESALERVQVHVRGPDYRRTALARRPRRAARRRHRRRHSRGGLAADVRAVPSRQAQSRPHARRHRHRSGAGAGAGSPARRRRHGRPARKAAGRRSP